MVDKNRLLLDILLVDSMVVDWPKSAHCDDSETDNNAEVEVGLENDGSSMKNAREVRILSKAKIAVNSRILW